MTERDAITVLCVPPDQFGAVFPFCSDTLQRGLKLCDLEQMGDVSERIQAASLQVWMVTDGDAVLATCFTDINVEHDGARFVAVYGLAGQRIMKWARKLSDALAAFAREECCSHVRFAGRPGWEKLLPEYRRVERRGNEWIWERAVAH
jgi:hypothetical protein